VVGAGTLDRASSVSGAGHWKGTKEGEVKRRQSPEQGMLLASQAAGETEGFDTRLASCFVPSEKPVNWEDDPRLDSSRRLMAW
jgi:hypothetical protein